MTNFIKYAIWALLLLPSCQEPIDLFQESDEGKNVLSFTFNGIPNCVHMKVEDYHTPSLRSGYNIENGILQIDAVVYARDNQTCAFDYLFLDIPVSKDEELDNEMIEGALVRCGDVGLYFYELSKTQYDAVPELTSSWVKIRKFDYNSRICSGSFGCCGTVTGKDGESYPFEITDGLFDVRFNPNLTESNSTYRANYERRGLL